MNSKSLSILMAAALGFVSLSSRAAPQPDLLKPPDRSAKTSPSVAGAYAEKRWIGLRGHGMDRCPKVTGWASESLVDLAIRKARESEEEKIVEASYVRMENASPTRQIEISTGDLRLLHKLKLDRYCIYNALPGSTDFPKPSGLIEAGRDRMALTTTSAGGLPTGSLGQKIWSHLAKQFRGETGQEISSGTLAPQSALRLESGAPSVRLTFVDSQPDGEWDLPKPSSGDSQHGFTLAHLAHGLVCPPSGPCAATIAARRALGYQRFDPEAPLSEQEVGKAQSGHMGLVSDLAAAILAEVLHWRDAGTSRHLILNLSLGWDGQLFKDLEAQAVSQLDPSVEAVYKALCFARRSGVLVIAAAGNDRGGMSKSEWPLLPAAWDLRRPTLFHLPFGRKPVYAVGGVDSQGLSLPNTRRGGQPRRVAYADHSVTWAGAPNGPTAIYTGTSVSAAVASSIAAIVWHLRPELKPAQVMRLIVQSGDIVEAPVDFYAWKKLWPLSKLVSTPRARQLSLCPAVAKACGPDGKRCSSLGQLAACSSWSPNQPGFMAAVLGNFPGEKTGALKPLPQKPSKTPGPLVDVSSERWLFPQPEENPCPSCTLVIKPPPSTLSPTDPFEYELVLEISSSWETAAQAESVSPQKTVLSIDCPDVDETYELVSPPVKSGSVYRMTGPAQGKSLENCKAQLIFEMQTPQGLVAVHNPVLIGPEASF